MKMSTGFRARKALEVAIVKVEMTQREIDQNQALTTDEKFQMLWELGIELHQSLEAFRIP